MNLTLTPRAWQKMPWDKVAPYNDRELVLFLSPNLSIVLRRIRSITDNLPFNIKQLMQHDDYKTIFACPDFEGRLETFAKGMDTRLERVFVTKKSTYLFFDEEEQESLKSIVSDVALTCVCEIQRRKKVDNTFSVCPLATMTESDYTNIAAKLKKAGIECHITLDEYMRYTKKFHTFKRKDKDKETLDKIFADFPELNKDSKQATKKAYKKYAAEMHPDKNPDNPEAVQRFQELQDAWEDLQKTKYFQNLKEEAGE